MKKTRTYWPIQWIIMVLPALSILNLQEALADSEPDKIVVVDLLTVKEPKSEAESRLRGGCDGPRRRLRLSDEAPPSQPKRRAK